MHLKAASIMPSSPTWLYTFFSITAVPLANVFRRQLAFSCVDNGSGTHVASTLGVHRNDLPKLAAWQLWWSSRRSFAIAVTSFVNCYFFGSSKHGPKNAYSDLEKVTPRKQPGS
jgi:hypothetical protein